MTSRIDSVLTLIFSLIWGLLIFAEYWYYHPDYAASIKYFQYVDLVLILSLLGAGIGFGLYKVKEMDSEKILSYINGASVLALFLIISGIIIVVHASKVEEGLDWGLWGVLAYLGKILFVLFACYFIFATCYVLGDLAFTRLFSFSFNEGEGIILKIATGITLFSILLVILGFVKLLFLATIIPISLIILGLGRKSSLRFVKKSLFTPIQEVVHLDWIGFVSFFLLLVFISLNLLQNIRPFPFGFDALSIYLNLPQLISENNGLIEGYSPYYWSLFIALGHIVFDQIEVVIALSVSGAILSLFVIYEIARKWLDVNIALLTLVLFYSLPLINYQSYRDIKTDLGLLFILLSIILVLIKWLSLQDHTSFKSKELPNAEKAVLTQEKKNGKQQKGILAKYLSESDQLLIVCGILSGMAIGIKLTGLIVIFGVLGALAYVKGREIGFLTAFFILFSVILIGGLDVASGLRAYHFGADYLMKGLPFLAVMGVVYLFIKKRNHLISLIKCAFIYILFIGLVYLPWPIKNYQETKTISFSTLIEGKDANMLQNVNQIINNARKK